MDKEYTVRRQSDLVNTRESVHPVCDQPYYTNKGKVQKGEKIEVFRNYALSARKNAFVIVILNVHINV